MPDEIESAEAKLLSPGEIAVAMCMHPQCSGGDDHDPCCALLEDQIRKRDAAVAAQARAEALAWSDSDAPLPEDDAIKAAHPLRTGDHATYAEAMRLVSARRSKGALVELVNWLLVRSLAAGGK